MTVRVLIADDQAMVREGFSVLLGAQPDIEIVGAAVDGEEAVTKVDELRPDVVLMDIRMPLLNGLEATRRILGTGDAAPPPEDAEPAHPEQVQPGGAQPEDARAENGRPQPSPPDGPDVPELTDTPEATAAVRPETGAGTKVLVLTTFDLDEYVYEALRSGASGFLLKDSSGQALAEAVRVVASGDALLSPSITRRLITEFSRLGAPRAPTRTQVEQLTERETEVLVQIARGLSNSEIAASLVVAEQTVKTHVSRILVKLELRDRTQAAIFAYETGLIRPHD